MADSLRRTIEELRTLYVLHGRERDVIVEARRDADLLLWFFHECGIRDVQAYAIDDRVSVPSNVVIEQGFPETSKRVRALALAKVAHGWGLEPHQFTVVVDQDFDCFEQPDHPGNVITTDYPSMDVYYLLSRHLGKFLHLSGHHDREPEAVVDELRPAWNTVFCARYVALKRHLKFPKSFASRCQITPFDGERVARELLRGVSPTPSAGALDQMMEEYATAHSRLPAGTLAGIRGHDIAPLLIAYLKLRNRLADPDNLEFVLTSCLDAESLRGQPLFGSLLDRMGS